MVASGQEFIATQIEEEIARIFLGHDISWQENEAMLAMFRTIYIFIYIY